jgi:ParB-like chromosome segregation protein Spo0J
MKKPTLKQTVTPYLDDLAERKVTSRDVAKRLGVSEAHLSRTLKDLGIVKAPSERQKASALYHARKEYQALVATTMTPEQAASAAHCSVKTIHRTLERLKCKTTA